MSKDVENNEQVKQVSHAELVEMSLINRAHLKKGAMKSAAIKADVKKALARAKQVLLTAQLEIDANKEKLVETMQASPSNYDISACVQAKDAVKKQEEFLESLVAQFNIDFPGVKAFDFEDEDDQGADVTE